MAVSVRADILCGDMRKVEEEEHSRETPDQMVMGRSRMRAQMSHDN